ncbi:hypothetical protein M514_03980 [Trichuris suis]|uniref:Uncharacterized protein n=1 Tax=Trichuris suis TaxID=68888 RepID=A0A085NSY3_9BILA|nr:hypothetical protein M513_03980 [Trichuris suis]KFD72579.1 hypothetical protein M514_03980 [Trichuris suis]
MPILGYKPHKVFELELAGKRSGNDITPPDEVCKRQRMKWRIMRQTGSYASSVCHHATRRYPE